MRTLILTALVGVSLPGCVIYDHDKDCWDDEFCDAEWSDEDPGNTDDPAEEEEEDLVVLSFFPGQAEQGETFLASIKVAEGEVNLLDVENIVLYGDAELLVWGARADEITSTIKIGEQADGILDVVVEFSDGSAELIPGALTIYPEGSGNQADDWSAGDDGSDPGADDGDCE